MSKRAAPLALVLLIVIAAAVVWKWRPGGSIVFSPDLPDSQRGTLEIRIKDHREAIGDFARLDLTVETIRLSPKARLPSHKPGWEDLEPTVRDVDLTKFTGKRSAKIFSGKLEARHFEAVHLKLGEVQGTRKERQERAPITNRIRPIKLPFSIRPGFETVIVLDLVIIDMSDHPPRAYELHVKGYELYANGQLVDKIPPG
jgi:hypothetical protein